MSANNLYGLIGYPLSHSFSKGYFADKFQREGIANSYYENFPIASIDLLPELIKAHPHLRGLNVTIPYKQLVMPYLHELSDAARIIGAVNTIKINGQHWKGFNTDEIGFRLSLLELLQPYTEPFSNLNALVLGTGGAAKAVNYVLKQLNINYLSVSRMAEHGNITYEQIDEAMLKQHLLVINTTPLGMMPNTTTCPLLPYSIITEQHFFYDLVYNPLETLFLEQGKMRGARTMNGLKMLHLQAEAAWEIWKDDL
jgi:shikimate dehydrogenase